MKKKSRKSLMGVDPQAVNRILKPEQKDSDSVISGDQSEQTAGLSGQLGLRIETTGDWIGRYRLLEKIGEGGMGEVYRGTDTKLDRDVAIKILPASCAGDSNRVARFQREAKVLAALNHPNIAVIYGIEKTDDSHALVMELVEGETLGQRLKREPMTVEEALECCQQIAHALEAAHENGIIHRDLKPQNVTIASDGHVKVLDFGLAKVLETKPGDSPSLDDPAESLSTTPGELLGTAPYMSPEQARTRPVDQRSDIWSFGCVLFECLTGKRMFQGEGVTEILATILKGDPDWSALPEDTPATIHLLLRKCLNKDRRRRLQSIADARVDLDQALGDPTSSILRLSDGALQESAKRAGTQWLLIVGAMVLVALVAVTMTWFLKPETPSPIRRIPMDLGVEGNLHLQAGPSARLSPDGSTLAYIVRPGPKLYLRRLDQVEPTELTAEGKPSQFCFSPDSQWIAFYGWDSTIRKVSVTGGAVLPVCETSNNWGLDWSDDGWIVFAPGPGLSRVSSAGQVPPEPLTKLSVEEHGHRWPQVLPGGQAVLYTSRGASPDIDDANIMVQRAGQGDPKLVRQGGYHARYLPSGHLVYIQEETLFAAAFDLESLTLTGQPSPVIEEVAVSGGGGAHFDVSADGTLVYASGIVSKNRWELEWVDRQGNRELFMPADTYGSFKLSPDARFLAYSLHNGVQRDIWIYDLERELPTRLTFDPAIDNDPVWSPSGESIVFRSERDRIGNLYWKRVDSRGEAQRLTVSPNSQIPYSWHPYGRHLAIRESTSAGGHDLRIVHLEEDDSSGWEAVETTDFEARQFDEYPASFSPKEGGWLAYASDESGVHHIFVDAFPGGGNKKQISIEGQDSCFPLWSETNQELFYFEVMGPGIIHILTSKYRVEEGEFKSDRPVRWEGGTANWDHTNTGYDLHPDGDRILVRKRVKEEDTEQRVVLFENFFDYLHEQVPTDGN